MSACPECPEHLDLLYEVGFLERGGVDEPALVEVAHVLLEVGASAAEVAATTSFDERRALVRSLVPDSDRTRVSAAEVAREAGIPVETVRVMLRMAGLPPPGPDEAAFRSSEIVIFQTFAAAAQIVGEEATLQFGRVAGEAMSRVAEAASSAFLVNARDVLTRSGASEADLLRLEATGLHVLELTAQVLTRIFWLHMDAAISRQDGRELPDVADVRQLAVGFLDLVGSTVLVEQLPADRLAQLLATFEDRVVASCTEHGSRLVKFIGDEAMIVAPEVASVIAVVREVAGHLSSEPELTGIRAAVTSGPVLLQGGDCFGRPVNLAARAIALADPGRIVVDPAAMEGSGEGDAVDLGETELKGFQGSTRLFALTIDREREDT